MRHPTRRIRAFGLVELMIGLVLLSFLMIGVYKFSISSTRSAMYASKSEKLSRGAAAVRFNLERNLRMIGYNPRFKDFPVCTATGFSECGPANERMGIIEAKTSEITFTSDDNGIVFPTSGDVGAISGGETYSLWVADDELAPHVSFQGLTKADADPCTENGAPFTTLRKLYGTKKLNATSTQTVLLAENVLCFEIQYYRDADPLLFDSRWVRLCPRNPDGTVSSHCPTTPGTPTAADPRVSQNLEVGPPFGGMTAEMAYYDIIKNDLSKIVVGLVLEGHKKLHREDPTMTEEESRKERIVFEVRLPNRPWALAYSN